MLASLPVQDIHSLEQLLKFTAVIAAAISAVIIIWYLVTRPPLGRLTKVLLLFGLGIMPIGVALTGNVAGFEYTLKRQFCSSCHVMLPYTEDAADPKSDSLAAIHSRNKSFGGESCYTCHADYKIFGAMTTKLNGLKHMYYYVTQYADSGAYGENGPRIHLYKPFKNESCTRCHSTTAPNWLSVEDHGGMIEDLRAGNASCVDCHGGAQVHPRSFNHGGKGRAPTASAAGERKE
jgi:cytochrome c-type protein NapC